MVRSSRFEEFEASCQVNVYLRNWQNSLDRLCSTFSSLSVIASIELFSSVLWAGLSDCPGAGEPAREQCPDVATFIGRARAPEFRLRVQIPEALS